MKNNKNCRVLVATLITVLSFTLMIFAMVGMSVMFPYDEPTNWHVGGLFLALLVLALVCWLTKTATYTITTVKNHEENWQVKLVFEVLTGLALIFALIAFVIAPMEDEHITHLAQNFAMLGTPLAFISSLATNVLGVKK